MLLTIDVSGVYSNGVAIGTLPQGFRPSETITVVARIAGNMGTFDITILGSITPYNISDSASGAAFAQASYVAAD